MSREAITSALGGHAAAAQGTTQGRVSALTRTPAAGQQPCCNPVRHGSGSRTWQRRQKQDRGELTRRATWGAQGLLGSWGPHPWLFVAAGRQGHRPGDRPHQWQSSGYLGPRPWLFGAARTPGRARLNISQVLGSLPWLFESLMATQDRTDSKATSDRQGWPRPSDRGKAGRSRDGKSTVPTQGLGCQQATCTLKVGGKGQGARRHKRGTEARQGSATSG